MYRLWSEWDIGESKIIFATKDAGLDWLRNNPNVAEIAKEDKVNIEECIESCFADGFFYWETLEIIK